MLHPKKSLHFKTIMAAPEDPFIEQCKAIFTSMDLDGDGRLTPFILGKVMKQFGWTVDRFDLVVRTVY